MFSSLCSSLSLSLVFFQLPAYLTERHVYYKQASALFFRTSTFLTAHLLAEVPIYWVEVRKQR